MDWIKEWIPLITSGLMLAFGAAIWAMVRGILKSFDNFLNNKAPKLDLWTEKYMGDEASNEMWRQLRTVGESLVRISNEMIALDSFQKNLDSNAVKTAGAITDLSERIKQSDK